MGRVTEIRQTGDNDESIYPIRYYMHYLYCDQCGSFAIKHWIEPDNHLQIDKRKRRLTNAAIVVTLVGIVFGLLIPLALIIFASLLALILLARFLFVPKIHYKGAYCADCSTQYENGTPFFSSTENPRNYTMDDVPLPLNTNYQVRGEEVVE